jgi:hypothetical protein
VPEELEGLERSWPTSISATSRSSSRCPTRGRSTSSSRWCRSTASTRSRRAARARRHHLRLRRQDRPLHRPARRQARARAAPARRRRDYYLGIFLVGAYQEILGDLHNLFGDTNTLHVSIPPGGGYHIDHVLTGDTVAAPSPRSPAIRSSSPPRLSPSPASARKTMQSVPGAPSPLGTRPSTSPLRAPKGKISIEGFGRLFGHGRPPSTPFNGSLSGRAPRPPGSPIGPNTPL